MATDLNGGIRAAGTADREKKPAADKPAELLAIEQRFIDALGTKVAISGGLKRGSIKIDYYSMDDLDRLYSILAGGSRMSHRNQQMKTVLVVDDEESILEIAAAILDRGGFKAVCVDSVDAAEHALRTAASTGAHRRGAAGQGGLDLLMTLRGRQPSFRWS
jgi:hypothetical protein